MKKCPVCNRAYSDMVAACPICHTSLVDNSAGTSAGNRVPPQNYSAPGNQKPQNYSAPVKQQPVSYQPQPNPTGTNTSNQQNQQSQPEKGNWLWYLPGLLIPLAGLIAWLCLRKNHPASAKMASTGALIGFVVSMALRFL